jgi:uncharacterized protein YjbJ (UPF0337 family)
MDSTEENGKLHILKGVLKQKFADLTENDQLFQEGQKQEMFGKHKNLLCKTEEELASIIATLD